MTRRADLYRRVRKAIRMPYDTAPRFPQCTTGELLARREVYGPRHRRPDRHLRRMAWLRRMIEVRR